MIFCFVRETKQLTLEEIDRKKPQSTHITPTNTRFSEVFSVPTKSFINYELTTWLPYFVKRHILRQDIVKPPPIIEKADLMDSDGVVGE